jgi:hypothetical protein
VVVVVVGLLETGFEVEAFSCDESEGEDVNLDEKEEEGGVGAVELRE